MKSIFFKSIKMLLLRKFIFGGNCFFRKSGYLASISQTRTYTPTRINYGECKTLREIREELAILLETDDEYTTEQKPRDHLMKYLPKTQEELPKRRMKDSFSTAVVPLSTDIALRDIYATYLGEVRLGRLVEDIDIFAVYCCTRHLLGAQSEKGKPFPYILVTIRVDDIEFMDKIIQPKLDIRVSGHVCWVGKSSLEVFVWLDQLQDGVWVRLTEALLLMGARNSLNTGPAIVNPLLAETPEEEMLLKEGEKKKVQRVLTTKKSLLKEVPTEEELHIVHNLFMQTIETEDMFIDNRVLPPNSKWMHNATSNNLVFCHPEHRNLHNKIFGGFLIRQALELSFTVAFLHGMRKPNLVHIKDITFYNPVDVGSMLKLYASITYTEAEHLQVFVRAEAINQLNPQGKDTTGFNFTYWLGKPLDQVYPSSYLEAMKFIDGRRNFLLVQDYKNVRRKKPNAFFGGKEN